MNKIKAIPLKDFGKYVNIVANAFPGFGLNTEEDKKRSLAYLRMIQQKDPVVNAYGCYQGKELIGGLRLFDFVMNFHSVKVPIGGAGLLAVDLMHKKEHVALDLMRFFMNHYIKRNVFLATLYPFRHDFYKKMGFGYGAKINEYRIKPANLPNNGDKTRVRFLSERDKKAVQDCYQRVAVRTHGLFDKCKYEMMRLNTKQKKVAIYTRGKKVYGYIVFEFKENPKNMLMSDMIVHEFIYENREAFGGLLSFLKSQADQVNEILLGHHNDDLHFVSFDPRDGTNEMIAGINHRSNTQGVGVMFRVLDIKKLLGQLKGYDFNGATGRLKLNINDNFIKSNDGEVIVHFNSGKATVMGPKAEYDVEVSMDISEFSSMMLGVVDFKSLYNMNLAEISDDIYLDTVHEIFKSESKPACISQF